jgi:hypothetical protein
LTKYQFKTKTNRKTMKKTKTLTVALAGVAGFALAVSQASAAFIVNGDFQSGAGVGFTSGYALDQSANGLSSGGEAPFDGAGEYSVTNNPNFSHTSFVSGFDHTLGTAAGLMMIVNGSGVAGKNVWSGTIAPPLTLGQTYEFSAWVENVFSAAPANVQFSFGGNVLGAFSATGLGVWQQFTANFVATANQTSGAVDLIITANGNDFALDDISLRAVPEPTTMIAGALLLLPFGASTLRMLRKNRAA